MNMREKSPSLSEQEIDQRVTAQAGDDSAWEEPVYVHREGPAILSLPADLAARAAFLARLHRMPSVEEWLTRVIEERVEFEESAFVGIKQDLAAEAG